MIEYTEIGVHFKKHGENLRVITPANIYGAEVGNDVFIGPFCEIQNDVKIGSRTKIQSHTFICSLVTIGDDCFIGHGVMFINDLFQTGGPARGNRSMWRPTFLNNRVSVGSNSTILPVEICANVVIGAGSVVTKDILESGIYVGNPAKRIRGLSEES